MNITILSHNLTSNAVMRAHRLALAARHFAEVKLIGPVKDRGAWAALPREPWIVPFESKKLPKFHQTILALIEAADGDVLIAVKPYLASFGVGLLAGQCRNVPVLLDLDDLDEALVPPLQLDLKQLPEGLRDPASLLYLQVLSRTTGAASGITVASSALQRRFGGTLVPHGCPVEQFDPAKIDRDRARQQFGFSGPVVLFPGTRRTHKGLRPLAQSAARIPSPRLSRLSPPHEYTSPKYPSFP